jgi:hypothetical protein
MDQASQTSLKGASSRVRNLIDLHPASPPQSRLFYELFGFVFDHAPLYRRKSGSEDSPALRY